MFYDIITILIILICVIVGYKRGAARTFVSLLVSFASYFLSSTIGNTIANFVYDNVIHASIEKSVSNAVSNIDVSDTASSIDKIINSLPAYIKTILSLSGTDFSVQINNALSGTTDKIVSTIDSILKGVIVPFLSFLIIIITFLILRFLLRITIGKLLLSLFRLGPVKTADSILGGVLGAVSAFFIISFIGFLLKLIMPQLVNVPMFMNESSIYNSYIFYYFYSGNIFSGIINIFTGGK